MSEAKTTILGQEVGDEVKPEDKPVVQGSSSEQDNVTKNYLEELVGDGKKYKSVDDLAKGMIHAQGFIETLKGEREQDRAELDEMKVQLTKAKTVEDVLSALNQAPANVAQNVVHQETKQEPQFDVRTAVEQALLARQHEEEVKRKQQSEQENVAKCWSLLSEKFGDGDKAKAAVGKVLKEDPSLAGILETMGKTNPDKFAKYILDNTPKDSMPVLNGPSTLSIGVDDAVVRGLTWSKAQELRRTNPKLYSSRKFQSLLHEMAAKDSNFMKR